MHFSAMYRLRWYRKAFLSYYRGRQKRVRWQNKPSYTHGCLALTWGKFVTVLHYIVVWRTSTQKVRCHRDCFLDHITRNGSTWQGLHLHADWAKLEDTATTVTSAVSIEKRYAADMVWMDGWNAMTPPPVISDQMPWVSKSEQNGATITNLYLNQAKAHTHRHTHAYTKHNMSQMVFVIVHDRKDSL